MNHNNHQLSYYTTSHLFIVTRSGFKIHLSLELKVVKLEHSSFGDWAIIFLHPICYGLSDSMAPMGWVGVGGIRGPPRYQWNNHFWPHVAKDYLLLVVKGKNSDKNRQNCIRFQDFKKKLYWSFSSPGHTKKTLILKIQSSYDFDRGKKII